MIFKWPCLHFPCVKHAKAGKNPKSSNKNKNAPKSPVAYSEDTTGFTKLRKYDDKKYYAGWGIIKCDDKKYYDRSYDPKLTLTFRPGNYTRRFSYGFGVVVRDLGEWRSGFYSEFRYASREHSGLPWSAILRKVFLWTEFQDSHVHVSGNKIPNCITFQVLQSNKSM